MLGGLWSTQEVSERGVGRLVEGLVVRGLSTELLDFDVGSRAFLGFLTDEVLQEDLTVCDLANSLVGCSFADIGSQHADALVGCVESRSDSVGTGLDCREDSTEGETGGRHGEYSCWDRAKMPIRGVASVFIGGTLLRV